MIFQKLITLNTENAQLKVDLMKSTELLKHKNGKKLRLVKGEIIQDNKELIFLTQRICKNNKKITLNLLYKATVDSDKASAFHHKCDNSPSTLVLVKSSPLLALTAADLTLKVPLDFDTEGNCPFEVELLPLSFSPSFDILSICLYNNLSMVSFSCP